MKKPQSTTNHKRNRYVITSLLICLSLFISNYLFAQTYIGASSTPTTDGGTQAGPTVAVAPVAGVQAGDLIVMYAHYRGIGVTLSISEASGQTWSNISNLSNNNQTFAVFWCRFNGTWGPNPAVTIGAGTNGMSVIMYAFRPTNNSRGWTVNATTAAATSNNATVPITGHTTSAGNTVTMGFWGSPAASTWNTAPTLTPGWTKPGFTQYRNATTGQSHSAAYKISATAGATGNVSQTQNSTQQTKTCLISWSEVDLSDVCSGAISLTPGITCVTILGSLNGSTYTAGSGVPGGGGCNIAGLDVWYKFIAQSDSCVITTTRTFGTGLRRTELYEGSCGALVSKGCSGDNNNLTGRGLVFGQTYYVRVYSADANPYDFTICLQNRAAVNGTCATAITLTPATSCTPVAGDLFLADSTSYSATGTSSCGNNTYDMWYRFVAPANYDYASITVTPTGSPSALTTANTFIETFKANCTLNGNSTGCSNISAPRNIAIEEATVYYFKVYTTAQSNVYGSSFQFNICITLSDGIVSQGSRMREVFKQTILSPPDPSPDVLIDPWEVTYGPDNKLWITESKGYRVYTMDPLSGTKTMVLDIRQGSTWLGPDTANIRSRSNNGSGSQGGLAGLALHPNFMDGTANEKNYVYISYVFVQDSSSVFNGSCRFYKNKIVRFTYDEGTNRLGSPVRICDTLPGGDDHNSQRMIIAPVVKGGPKYLFYASGDLGGGQLNCRLRWQKAQHINSYEGKILRFNLETSVTDPMTATDPTWIPDDNPYNATLGVESAVWVIGIRNNQGFAYDSVKNILYGSSHGPYSDDEINIIERRRNYGHPYVIGYASDGNYDGDSTIANQRFSAGSPFTSGGGVSMCPPVGSEMNQKKILDSLGNLLGYGLNSYKDPLFSAYPGPATGPGSVDSIWRNNPGNANPAPGWPSEGWSGLDLYSNSKIPGWKKSLVAASLKWGRLVRIKLNVTGDTTMPSNSAVNNAGDSMAYFGSQNKFRDLAFDPNGRDIYVIMDRSTTTSGPSAQWPVVPSCMGCVQKYTFLGYNVNSGDDNKSMIPTSITVAPGKNNTCDSVNSVTINAANDNTQLWVPLTDTASNIVAEIYAMGEDLGRVTAKVYHNSNTVRSRNGKKYLDRNITITPEFQPTGDVKIRLYITKAEYDALVGEAGSGVDGLDDVKIFKNNDGCGAAMSANPNAVTMEFDAEAFGTGAYVLQGTIDGFSSFYFASTSITTLPLDLINFSGLLQSDNTVLLKWKTENEINTSHFEVQRSIDGRHFTAIGNVTARGQASANYLHTDAEAANQQSAILYYRLKIMDADGTYKYSTIVTIRFNSITTPIKVSPNPTKGIVAVNCIAVVNEKARWQLIDNAGRVILQNTVQLKSGNNNWSIDISGVSAGIYYLSLTGTGIDQKVKIQKL